MSYEPLHHKYRPQTFADLVGQEAIATTLTNAITSGKIAPAYLFTGPRGTGKTSSARILAKSLNCISSEQPTPIPCGKCEVCRAIARSSALDVIEIDAASNTGVDNIREIIERSQFAPVQCRYKVYVIDECLTGNSLVFTRDGLIRIDNPNIKGKQVLSYNDNTQTWEYKKVLRWLKRGSKQTLVIKTTKQEIQCTDNHLIRTDEGWIQAKNLKPGMQILSPANVDAAHSFTNMERIDASVDLLKDINFTETPTVKNLTILPLFWNKPKYLDLCVPVDAEKNWIFPIFYNKKVKDSKVSNLTGRDIHTEKDTDFGIVEQKTFSLQQLFYPQIALDSSTVLYWETEVSTIPTLTADSLDYVGHIVLNNENGWSTKLSVFQNYNLSYDAQSIKDTENSQSTVEQPVILNLMPFSKLSNHKKIKNAFLWTGLNESHQKDWLGGIWMMVQSASQPIEVHPYNSIQKDSHTRKISLLPAGSQIWDIQPKQCHTQEKQQTKRTITSQWEQKLPEDFCQTCSNTQFPQWLTNLETVKSVQVANIERVYDIEVEDNHNFVANGLLVHNCHMLSTAAFNALLKTLEEPPDRVIFVLATTDPQRVLPTIISRCQRFDYRRIPIESMVAHLSKIANLEKIDINPEAITLVAQIANGGLRDAESLLDQLSLLSDTITPEKIWELVGAIPERDLLTLLKVIRSSIPDVVIEQCRHLMNRGKEPLVVLQNLAGFYLNLLLAKTAPNRPEMVAVTAPTWQELCTEAKLWSLDDILSGQQHLKNSEAQLKNTTQPRLWLEVTLLGLLPLSSPSPTKEITPQFVPKTVPTPTTSNAASSQIQKDEPSLVIQEQPIEKPTSTPSVEPIVVQKQEAQLENQEQIWEQMIENIELPTTQTLMRQHGSLLSFKDSVAEISIASEALLKLVRQRIAGVEAAFEVVCHRKIKVNLRLASSELETVTDAISINPQVSLPPVESVNIQVPEPTIPAPTAQLSTENKQEEVSILSSETISVNRSESREAFAIPSPVEELEQQYSEDEITKAAQSLAQYFEGEVVNFTPKSSEVEIQPTPSVIKEELEALETIEQDKKFMLRGRPILEEVDDDEDIPFVRPASMRTRETQLQDPWELEANRPGLWLHGIRDLWL